MHRIEKADTMAPALNLEDAKRRKDAPRTRRTWAWAGWEPDRYYTRAGASYTPYFGNGDWIASWRNRLETEETLKRLADDGVTLLITQFYKGMGVDIERPIWPSLGAFVERAARYDLDILGYVQGHSLFGEFLFLERPDARDWVAQDRHGVPHTWGAAYNRFAPCLSSSGYRQYMKDIMSEGLEVIGFAGIHIDNSYSKHCYCPRCRILFRDWLDRREDFVERTGIPVADAVEPPPLSSDRQSVHDPLVRLWIEFGVTQRLEFLSALRQHLEQIAPDTILSSNPAFLKSYAYRLTHGVDPSLESRVGDLILIENGNLPRFENGRLFTQADKLLFAEAGGSRSLISSWRPGALGHSPPDGSRGVWALLAEEYSFCNCLPGNNWMLRPAGDGAKMLSDVLTEEVGAFRDAMRFFAKVEDILNSGDRSQFADVCLYVDPDSLALNPSGQALALQTFLGYALQHRVPLRIAYAGRDVSPDTRVMVLCQQSWLSDAELMRLKRIADESKVKIWLLGPAALHNEWGVSRSASARKAFENHRGIESFNVDPSGWADLQGSPAQYFQGASVRWRVSAEPELVSIVKRLALEQSIEVRGEVGLLINVEIDHSGRLLVHLRDLDVNRDLTSGACLRIDSSRWARGEVRGFSPSWFDLRFVVPESEVLSVPDFRRYAVLVFEPKRVSG